MPAFILLARRWRGIMRQHTCSQFPTKVGFKCQHICSHFSTKVRFNRQHSMIHDPCTPPKRILNASIHAPSQHKLMGPIPIPAVDLSLDRRVQRVIEPQRECDLVVLLSGGPVSLFCLLLTLLDSILVSTSVADVRHVYTGRVNGV